MKKAILTLVLGLLASGAFAQQGFYCAHTGFDNNLGDATKSFRCRPELIRAGSGTLTLNGTSTITVSPAAFQNIVAPDALPGGDGVFFKTSGIIVTLSNQAHFYRVTAKASDSSITVIDGAAAPTESGTTTVWSYWNTTCYRSASAVTDNNDFSWADPRLWRSIGSDLGLLGGIHVGDAVCATLSTSTNAATLHNIVLRPGGLATVGVTVGAGMCTSGADEVTAQSAFLTIGLGQFFGHQASVALASDTVANYFAFCIYRAAP